MADVEETGLDETAEDGTGQTRREGPGSKRTPTRKTEPGESPRERFERGTLIGRYVTIDVLGEGGMGVVYAAYDPELDRKVAIKLLEAQTLNDATGGQAWLLREAQALARLAHPNVIAVHDVGTLPGDRVFIAMELVDGDTLRAWMRERERGWREVIAIMRDAGAGLTAAHAAGLVHRDFKPENVLVGKDGRVRVMDFGLARLETDGATPAARTSDLQIETRSPLTDRLTQAGTVVGTPAYMAPEIYDGAPADARSDQYAFGVTLYEGLFRTRPYDKKAPRGSPPKQPTSKDVPAPIQRAVMRAISVDPAERFPSLDALLAELALDPYAKRRRIALGAAALVLLGGASAGVYSVTRAHPGNDQLCKGAEQRLTGVWDPATKKAVHTAFSLIKKPYAEAAYTGLERALDAYAASWTASVVDSCEATRVRGIQSPEVMALREDCLDQRLAEVRALTGLLAKADDPMVSKGDSVVHELEPVSRCANLTALRAPVQPSPEVRAKLPELGAHLADARVAVIAGHYPAAETAAKAALDLAKPLNYDPGIAEAMLELGAAQLGQNKSDDATATFADAGWAALRGKRDDIVVRTSFGAAMTAATTLGSGNQAKWWLGLGGAALARFGGDPWLELQGQQAEGIVAAEQGNYVAAIEAHRRALATATGLFKGADEVAVWQTEELFGTTLVKAASFAEARPHFERALALRQASVGPDHLDIALILSNLGTCYNAAGDLAKAHDSFDRSIAIRERMFGKESPMLAAPLNNLADMLRQSGDAEGALGYIERAKQLVAKVPGPKHPLYHIISTTHAEVLATLGKAVEARAEYETLIAAETSLKSPILGTSLSSYAQFAVDQHDYTLAISMAEPAITAIEAAGGKDAADLWRPLASLAYAKIATNETAAARPLLDRAIAIAEQQQVKTSDLAPARAALAALPK
ncbi:MAG TPA: serine/threonine-protein kinase [Kofleriaceae bacterium]|jgi:tetratricopeptide (TPR) repeat protein